MQNAMRRTLGVGGAAAIALAASLALAGVADAHTPKLVTSCLDNGQASLSVNLSYYTPPRTSDEKNTITISYTPDGGTTKQLLPTIPFTSGYPDSVSNPTNFPVDGAVAGAFSVVITAWDDPNGDHSVQKVGQANAWDGTFTVPTSVCPQTGPTTVPTQPTQPPTPPTKTPTSSPAPTTTAAAVVPVANQTPPTAKPGLAFTGVSTELPLIIGGALIVLGAGALITMRVMKRRRVQS